MKRSIFTPACRASTLSLLFRHLLVQKEDFDEWILGLNTPNDEDRDFCETIARQYDWIKLIEVRTGFPSILAVSSFYRDLIDSDTVYLRLDDDIVWMRKGAVAAMFEEVTTRERSFFVFGNVVNTAICSHLHQRAGVIPLDYGIVAWNSLDPIARTPHFGKLVHERFLDSLTANLDRKWLSQNFLMFHGERVSMSVAAWRGYDMDRFSGIVPPHDTDWLTDKAKEANMPSLLCGIALFSHYAYGVQREFLDKTDILVRYGKIAPKITGMEEQ